MMMWTRWLLLSLVTIAATRRASASDGADHRTGSRQLQATQLEQNPEWQKYFASPLESPVHAEQSVLSGTKPSEEDIMEGPGHAWVMAPHLASVIHSHGSEDDASTSTSASHSHSKKSSKKHKHKSKSKSSSGSAYNDDFFDYLDDSGANVDVNGTYTESSNSYRSKSLKKKASHTSGDREPDCQIMNGIYFGRDCEDSKCRIVRWTPDDAETHIFSVCFVLQTENKGASFTR